MNPTRRTLLKSSASAALIGITGRAAFAVTTYNYKVATNVPMAHPLYIRLNEAAGKIKQQTNGQVVIRVFPNGQLGSDTDMLSQVRSGGLDFLTLPGVVLANLVPMASLNSVGFAFDGYPAVWKAMDGKLGGYIRAQIAKSGLVVADKVWDNGFRQITSAKPVNSAADLRDLKIRVPVSPLLLSLFKGLGSTPTPINFNELYSALQTHIVDAEENPLPIIATAKLNEVQKHCALTSHAWDGYWFLANKRSWEALPVPLREIVNQNINAAAVAQRADSEKLALELEKDLTAKGMIFNRPPVASFRETLRKNNFYAQWKAKFGDEAWAQLEAETGKLA
jgi:tripartite ATP-independent transporter DctP family solute receptor